MVTMSVLEVPLCRLVYSAQDFVKREMSTGMLCLLAISNYSKANYIELSNWTLILISVKALMTSKDHDLKGCSHT